MVCASASSNGHLPIYQGSSVTISEKPSLNFDGIPPDLDRLWYGRIVFEIDKVQWVLDDFLNSGAEGQTYSVTRTCDGKRFVAKFCHEPKSREVGLLKQMPLALMAHPNFITYEMLVLDVQSHFAPAHHVIFMEHVPNGELFELLSSEEPGVAGKPVSEGTMRRFLHDVIHGMAECYRHGITHRDLKPENLLINEHGSIVIIDLGHAKCGELTLTPQLNRHALADVPPQIPLVRHRTANAYGTSAFNAPEVSSGVQYDCESADVWSLGVIAFYLHSKLPAFEGGAERFDDIMGTCNSPFWQQIRASGYYPSFPDGLMKFINMLWRGDPSERPSFSQLELAIKGDMDTIARFPGLQWLSQPVNGAAAFIKELRNSCPGKTFNAA